VLACSRAENEMVGVPSGILDQSASLLCEAGYALLLDCRSRQSDLVPFDMAAAGLTLAVIDTHAQHAHAGGGYVQRRRECDEAARQLGVTCLREVDDVAALRRLDDPVLVRRAWHVITENERVLTAVSLLRAGDMRATGELLFASHESLAKDFEVSWPEADAAVAAARGAGAYGARMVGGGFGGSVVALMPANDGKVPDAIREEFAGHGWQAPGFLPAQPSAGARCLR
jgi:galactokinase